MSFRQLTALFSVILGLGLAAPAFAQVSPLQPADLVDLADIQLKRQVKSACNELADQFPVGNTAPECAARHEACTDDLFDKVKAALAEAFEQCNLLSPAGSFQCTLGIREGQIIETEKAKIAEDLQVACQPLPPPPAVDNGADTGNDNGQIVADEVAAAQGGCSVTGLGGAEGNLLWTALGLLPLLGLRRKG
ncbi:MAG: hypothetical protein IT572_06295 [Deltaproteobacteria bacterium]|nr:hypothetical protein [Deltaproteobacteria bacterium]